MSATVVAYSAHLEDDSLSLKVDCMACGIEWAWTRDSSMELARLEGLARAHNESHHPVLGGVVRV